MTYLDFNASAPMSDTVRDAVAAACAVTGNPSSVHRYGRKARTLVEDARRALAEAVGARPEDVVFTSGATEANALALRGSGRRRALVSAVEHESVLNGATVVERIPVSPDGRIDLERLRTALSEHPEETIVSVMLANNETGVLQLVDDVVALASEVGALVHCDGVQGPGRVPVDFAALGVDLMSLSAHKMGGPSGCGALILRRSDVLTAVVRGGGQERGLRGGTENVTGIAGFGTAAREAIVAMSEMPRIGALRDGLEGRIRALSSEAVIFGTDADRLPNTCCVALPGVSAEAQVMALDLAGIAVSAGSACSSGKITPSHVLLAMGASDDLAASAIRVSLGPSTVQADVDAFLDVWAKLAARANRDAA